MTRPPFPMDIGTQPIAQQWAGRPVSVRFVNSGSLRVRVYAETVVLNTSHNQCVPRADRNLTVIPDRFTVAPFHGQTVQVVKVPPLPGDYGVEFIAEAIAGKGGHHPVAVESAVGSQITVSIPGHLTYTCGHKLALAARAPSGFPVLPVALIAVIVLGILAGMVWILRRPPEMH
jgi:hypothetical protein